MMLSRSVFQNIVFILALSALFCPKGVMAQDAAAAPKGKTIEVFGKSEMVVPTAFQPVPKRSRILDYEFKATDKSNDQPARVTMMASGGGIDANIKRWKGQFTGGNEDAKKVENKKLGEVTLHLVDTNGNFTERMGGGPFAGGKMVQRRDYAMTGAILEYPDGKTYFVKMTGPNSVVQANREEFVKMLETLSDK
ncbi:MAG: hypothetical protein AAF664_08920 [Planctomycetota bacterium]